MQDYEEKIRPVKAALFAEALEGSPKPCILEVGMGTGPNLPFYAQQPVGFIPYCQTKCSLLLSRVLKLAQEPLLGASTTFHSASHVGAACVQCRNAACHAWHVMQLD